MALEIWHVSMLHINTRFPRDQCTFGGEQPYKLTIERAITDVF